MITNPKKPQAMDVKDEVLLRVAALLIKAINPALLPPLRNPVIIAIATISQEERINQRKISTFRLYTPDNAHLMLKSSIS